MAEDDLSLFQALQTVLGAAQEQSAGCRDMGAVWPSVGTWVTKADQIDAAIDLVSRRLGELSRQALDAIRDV